MKRKSSYTLLLFFMHLCFTYAQQIVTDSSLQPQELIDNLTNGSCAAATNATSLINGSVNNIPSYGFFERGTSDFPLENGIILSTGNVNSAGNTLLPQSLSDGNLEWETDSDILSVLNIDQTLNATSLEFDFTSINNSLSFKYVFASDEYQQQYPCNFQDVFAILIKEAGTSDPYINIALLPDNVTTINTSSIHPEIANGCTAENESAFQGYNINTTNFDGQTIVLNATTNITPGIIYHIKFVIADHIDQRFDSAVFIEAEGFGSSVDLGPDQTACGSPVVLDGNVNNNQATYKWLKDGIEISGESNSTLSVIEYGEYEVEVTIPLPNGSCTMTDSVLIDTALFLQAEPISDIIVCDEAPYDGVAIFDLSLKDSEIMQSLPSSNYIISYHLSQDDALNNLNAISGNYENTGLTETIYVRIESLDGDCLQLGNFNVEVGIEPNYNTIPPIIICSDFVINGVGYAELSYYAFEIANYEFNRTVTFHVSTEDAHIGENPITYATDVPFGSNFTYVRVFNDFTGCYAIFPIQIVIQDGINYDQELYIDLCLPPDQSTAVFDLGIIRDNVLAQYPGASVFFYRNYDNAAEGALAIFPGFLYENEVPYHQTIYMGVRLLDSPCSTILEVDLYTNLANNVVNENSTIERCDDSSNDNILDFDLIDVSNELMGDYEIDITYYNSVEDRANEVNPINQNIPFTVNGPTQTLFTVASANGCANNVDVTLKINPIPELVPQTIEYCGNPNTEEGYTTIHLNLLINTISQNFENLVTTLHATEEDAISGVNSLSDSYNLDDDNPILYIRVTNEATQCFNTTTLEVTITDSVAIGTPEPIIVCDDDLDGIATVNLESVIPQLSTDLSSLNIAFYDSYINAISNRFPITNTANYTTENTEIYIKVYIDGIDCFVLISFDVLIYNTPELNTITDYINCELDPNLASNFYFNSKDNEIINSQIGMQVLYFENETDAINRVNPIDKTQAYTNTSSPQTIYVRLENEQESSCFTTGFFQIETRQTSIYSEPTDIFTCDYNGTGLNTVDFTEKINEITNGASQNLSVSFHLSPLNADLGTNALPLSYTSTVNPQLIYARVENTATSCFNISTFKINTLALPEVNYNQSLISCGNNYAFEQQWDLTDIEPLILEGRQYGIEFIYFESESDLVNNSNRILNPENYTNTSFPQTLFVKVRNVSTGCYSTVPFSLIINTPPIINDFSTYNICENENNLVDLTEINEALLDNTYNILVSYHTSEGDAEANTNALNTNYNYTNTNESLFARVEYSTTNCYAVYPFQLVVEPLPIANLPSDLVACDDDTDGAFLFDLTSQNTAILNGQNPNDISVSYYNSQNNATENLSPLNTDYLAYNNEIIFVRVENNTTGCFDTTQFSIIVNPLPINAIEDQVICLNNLPLVVSAETGNSTDSYLWSTGVASSEIEIYDTGSYSVTITNAFGCEYTSTFNVTESESAVIDVVETIDFSDPNNITVTVNGIGNYLYQLNNLPVQSSNVFVNVPLGYNTIKVIDQNGCAQITREVMVIDAPKHMTPNSDGDFDTWHIVGVETLPGTIIHIFDRKGKLLKELGSNTSGWDGTYNGNKMPTGDYWYLATVNQNGKTFQVKGHFALRR
ncbi:T9SS type B sorting domain-containing protein [Winogradskyella echinorum]|uniref:T9SS type B sorting domain-containing protein n=1 Tax=Winogradskyella echinorum TaxID=538189 RepID=A0ABR6Y3E2_9FLAO|nr:T9SS type B sorting domain-containing protein [Winogradskyella echinorum]MBC3847261.1 T9SS type B sorting domain-containing protein [Winogradskyella echinorum]MBC5751609.1 T9SS type B sorting domain-containing protein [Winogradskyella echinorum]